MGAKKNNDDQNEQKHKQQQNADVGSCWQKWLGSFFRSSLMFFAAWRRTPKRQRAIKSLYCRALFCFWSFLLVTASDEEVTLRSARSRLRRLFLIGPCFTFFTVLVRFFYFFFLRGKAFHSLLSTGGIMYHEISTCTLCHRILFFYF